jgi:uncharacterized protein (DUF2384 family)
MKTNETMPVHTHTLSNQKNKKKKDQSDRIKFKLKYPQCSWLKHKELPNTTTHRKRQKHRELASSPSCVCFHTCDRLQLQPQLDVFESEEPLGKNTKTKT